MEGGRERHKIDKINLIGAFLSNRKPALAVRAMIS